MKNKTTLELIEKLESYRVHGIRCFANSYGFRHVKAVLRTRGIIIDDDDFFSRPKKNPSSVEIKSYEELFNNISFLCEN